MSLLEILGEGAMSLDQFVHYLVLGACAVLGWFLRELWNAVQTLKTELADLRGYLPTKYVVKEDYRSDLGRIYELLDKIYEKVEQKADR
jgi:hypothetical protein